ncbi:MAG: hypothetical protein AAF607_03840 [Pseudomonadota bacterium]
MSGPLDTDAALAAFRIWRIGQTFRETGAIPPFPTRNHVSAIAANKSYPDTLRYRAFELYKEMTDRLIKLDLAA